MPPKHNLKNLKRKVPQSESIEDSSYIDIINNVTLYIEENKGDLKAAANSASAKTTLEYVYPPSIFHFFVHVSSIFLKLASKSMEFLFD